MIKNCLLILVCLASFSTLAQTSPPSGTKISGFSPVNEYRRLRCYNGDGSTCFDYANYLLNETNNFRGYQLVLEQGCYEKSNYECCLKIRENRNDREKIKANCMAGDAKECKVYAYGLARIHGDIDLAKKFLQRSCELKDESACKEIDRLRYPREFELTKRLRESCSKNDKSACEALDRDDYSRVYGQ